MKFVFEGFPYALVDVFADVLLGPDESIRIGDDCRYDL